MVDLTSSTGGQYYGFSNTIFVFAGILVLSVVGFFAYKLVQSLQEKERKKEEKKRLKELKKKK